MLRGKELGWRRQGAVAGTVAGAVIGDNRFSYNTHVCFPSRVSSVISVA